MVPSSILMIFLMNLLILKEIFNLELINIRALIFEEQSCSKEADKLAAYTSFTCSDFIQCSY